MPSPRDFPLFRFVFAATLFSALPLSSKAAVRLLAQTTSPGSKLTEEIWFDGKNAHIDLGRPVKISVIFEGATGDKTTTVTQIDHTQKNYASMTEPEIRTASEKLRKGKNQLAEIMKGLSPNLQKKLGSLAGKTNKAQASTGPGKVSFKATGKQEKVGNFECQVFEGLTERGKKQTLCVARLEHLKVSGLSASDFEAAGELNRFFTSFASEFGVPEIPNFDPSQAKQTFGFEGIPVRVTQSSNGKLIDDTQLLEIQKTTAPSSAFKIPQDFQRISAAQMIAQ